MLQKKVKNHPRNKYIEFDEQAHSYTYYKKLRPKTPVKFNGITGLIADHCAPFERDKIAYFIAKRDGITPEEVLAIWDKDRNYGNEVHKNIENLVEYGEYIDCVELENFTKIMRQHNLTPIAAEWVIYNEDIERASPIDLVCERNGELVLVDLKTMKKPIKTVPYRNKNKKMKGVFKSIYDSSYWKYCLQVSFYKYWVEEKYKLKVSDINYILHIHKDNAELIPAFYLPNEIKAIHNELKYI